MSRSPFPCALPATVVSVLLLASCRIGSHGAIEIDGVTLRETHEQELALEALPEGALVLEAHQGDVIVEYADGPTRLLVELHERTPGAAHAHLIEGRLVARTSDGSPCAVGDIRLRTRGPLQDLTLGTGMGDVALRRVRVEGALKVETGMGDVEVREAGEPSRVALETGMGGVEVVSLSCARLEAETGMGSIRVIEVETREGELSSGMGSVRIERSKGGSLRAESGMGSVEMIESSFVTHDLDTGLGHVKTR